MIVTPGALFEVLSDSLATFKGNSDRQALFRLREGGESGRGRQKDEGHGLEELALSIVVECCSPAVKTTGCPTRDLPDNRLVIVAKQGYAVHKKHVIWGRSDHALSALTLLFGVRIFLSYLYHAWVLHFCLLYGLVPGIDMTILHLQAMLWTLPQLASDQPRRDASLGPRAGRGACWQRSMKSFEFVHLSLYRLHLRSGLLSSRST